MAASKKSTVLGLCLWEGTDKPRRVDFVADNEAIESQLGGHIQNDNLHLNDTRRKRLDTPTEVRTYTGTGAASRTILFGFSPSAVIVFADDDLVIDVVFVEKIVDVRIQRLRQPPDADDRRDHHLALDLADQPGADIRQLRELGVADVFIFAQLAQTAAVKKSHDNPSAHQ